MSQIANIYYMKQLVFVAALTVVTVFFSFSTLAAEEPSWRLIPDASKRTVWRVGSNGDISTIDFPLYYEKTNSGVSFESEPLPSPDQLKIAYIKSNDLWIYDIEKKKDQRCTNVGRPESNKFASVYVAIVTWSPDSKKILYRVLGGLTESESGEGDWKKEARKAKYGEWVFDITKNASSSIEIYVVPHCLPVWLPNGKFLIESGSLPLLGEIFMYDPGSHESRKVVQEHAWWSRPAVSADGRWAIIGAGQRVGWDSTGAGKDLRSQLKRIDLEQGKVIDITPLDKWGAFWSYAISPSGNSTAYFVKKSANRVTGDPNNFRGLVVVDDVEIFPSDLLVTINWINEKTIVAVTLKELIVLDSKTGKVIGSHQR